MTTWTAPTPATLPLPRITPRAVMQLFLAACALTALAGRLAFLNRSFDYDASMFIYLGKAVTAGLRFGHDITDNKFPTVGLMTSVCWRMFGINWAGYVILQTILSFASAVFLARCAARAVGEHARLPTLAAALVYLNFTSGVYGGFQLETLQIFFSIIAACGAIEAMRGGSSGDAFLVGLAAGCAAMLKPTGLAPLCAFALALLGMRHHTKLLAASLVGLAIPIAASSGYLMATEVLSDMPSLYRQIALYATQTPCSAQDLIRPTVVLSLAAFGIIVRGWVFRRPSHQVMQTPDMRLLAFTMMWLILEFAGAIMQRRMYAYHFLPVAAPASLLFGLLPRRSEPLPLVGALGPVMLLSLYTAMTTEPYPNPVAPGDLLPISVYFREHASPGDSIWQDPVARTLLETDLKPGSRFASLFIFGNFDSAALQYTPVLLEDFEQRRPAYLVLPTDVEARIRFETAQGSHLARSPVRAQNYAHAWHEVEYYARTHYVPVATIGPETIYRRSD